MKRIISVVLSALILAMCLTACGGDSSSKTYVDKLTDTEKSAMLIVANQRAQVIYSKVGRSKLNTNGIVDVASFKDSTDPAKAAVYNTLSADGDTGYVCINVGSGGSSFVQWSSDKKGTVVGQYPNPKNKLEDAKEIKFGTFKKLN